MVGAHGISIYLEINKSLIEHLIKWGNNIKIEYLGRGDRCNGGTITNKFSL